MKTIETKHFQVNIENLEDSGAFDGVIDGEKTYYTFNRIFFKTREDLKIGVAQVILCDEMIRAKEEDSDNKIYDRGEEIGKELIEILEKL